MIVFIIWFTWLICVLIINAYMMCNNIINVFIIRFKIFICSFYLVVLGVIFINISSSSSCVNFITQNFCKLLSKTFHITIYFFFLSYLIWYVVKMPTQKHTEISKCVNFLTQQISACVNFITEIFCNLFNKYFLYDFFFLVFFLSVI